MALLSKGSATVIVILLVLGLAVAQARVMGLQSCKRAHEYNNNDDWMVSIGRTGEKKSMYCGKTIYEERLCCESETRTAFEGCELADESDERPKCWGDRKVTACCIPSK